MRKILSDLRCVYRVLLKEMPNAFWEAFTLTGYEQGFKDGVEFMQEKKT